MGGSKSSGFLAMHAQSTARIYRRFGPLASRFMSPARTTARAKLSPITGSTTAPQSIVIRIEWGRLVLQEMVRVQGRIDGVKSKWCLVVVKTIREVVRVRIRIAQRIQAEILLNVFQDTAEMMRHVGHVCSLGVRRHDDQ